MKNIQSPPPFNKNDIFYYVYGFLHNKDYLDNFKKTLTREYPKIPLVENTDDFYNFSKAGRKLARLHTGYETLGAPEGVIVEGVDSGNFRVQKMKHPIINKEKQKDTIIYNRSISIKNIPLKAYDYMVKGRPAIQWVMEQYKIRTDKKSGITNDPNDYSKEIGNPRYILDVLLGVITISIETLRIVEGLPKLEFDSRN